MTYRKKELVVGFSARERRRFEKGESDVFINVEYDDDYKGYNEDEFLFYEILKKVGVKFDEAGRKIGATFKHLLVADNISFRWFKREFDKMIRERNGEDYYGFSDAKSAFMLGILSSEGYRQMLLADRMCNWFWRIVKMMEKIK